MNEPNPEDQFVSQEEVQEVVEVEGSVPEDDQDAHDDDDEIDEIDLSNNSFSYFDKHTDSIYLIATHPTLPLAVSGGGDDKAYLWTTHNRPPTLVCELGGQKESVVAGGFSACGKFLVTGDMAGQVRVWKSSSNGERWTFDTAVHECDEVVWIKFHPKRPVIAVGAADSTVWVYELGQMNNLAVLASHSAQTNDGAFIESAEELILVTAGEDSTIIKWDVYACRALFTLGPAQLHGSHPWSKVAVSPTGQTFAAGSIDGQLAIVKVDDGAVVQFVETAGDSVEMEARSIEALAWVPQAQLLAVGNVHGEIQLYSLANWKLRSTLRLDDAVTDLRLLSGKALVSSGMDSSLVVWDVLSGQRLLECVGHSEGVLGFGISASGSIVSAGDECVCLVFDASGVVQ